MSAMPARRMPSAYAASAASATSTSVSGGRCTDGRLRSASHTTTPAASAGASAGGAGERFPADTACGAGAGGRASRRTMYRRNGRTQGADTTERRVAGPSRGSRVTVSVETASQRQKSEGESRSEGRTVAWVAVGRAASAAWSMAKIAAAASRGGAHPDGATALTVPATGPAACMAGSPSQQARARSTGLGAPSPTRRGITGERISATGTDRVASTPAASLPAVARERRPKAAWVAGEKKGTWPSARDVPLPVGSRASTASSA
mmetsp:Transcript_5206/g.22167  ORF Transcript_5206/g.22167 Transcript_5206/m.22167 type:complete len:263 (-) Transcript_5206:396-1184(-)